MQGSFHWRNSCQESVGSIGCPDGGGPFGTERKVGGEEVAEDTQVDGWSHWAVQSTSYPASAKWLR